MKRFNVTGLCVPEKHYMVDLTERIGQIGMMVDDGAYFTINRARQYGKTTTLAALARRLKERYFVISLDFQSLGSASFRDENTFSRAFMRNFLREMKRIPEMEILELERQKTRMQEIVRDKNQRIDLADLFEYLLKLCEDSPKPFVLIVDEVDSASNNQVFLDFLAQLRSGYLERESKGIATFQSVILAGVYDVKNLKRRLRADEERKVNSPWNVAADFTIDMSLSREGIKGMLEDYEREHGTRMDTREISGLLYDYTSGYPYLVSRLCLLMDEMIGDMDVKEHRTAWTKDVFLEAVRSLLSDNNTLFESLMGKLEDYPELEKMLRELLFSGRPITYSPTNSVLSLAQMFGFVKNEAGRVIPANRIFDTLLYNHFLSADELETSDIYKASVRECNGFVQNGRLDMRRVLERFVCHFHELYGNCKEKFLEEEGRRFFLLYLRPIINGTGNYYIEARTRSLGRTDIVVDYRGEQFVVETKIWRGNEYNTHGESQLKAYLDDYNLQTGYLLSFNFNRKKQIGIYEMELGGKTLVEAVV